MKTFDQLNFDQKKSAIDMAFYDLTSLIADGTMDITLADPATNRRVERTIGAFRKNDHSRLVVLFLLRDVDVRQEISRLALIAAEDAEYNSDGTAIKEVDYETAKRIVG